MLWGFPVYSSKHWYRPRNVGQLGYCEYLLEPHTLY
jgi:hypothetical protein